MRHSWVDVEAPAGPSRLVRYESNTLSTAEAEKARYAAWSGLGITEYAQ